MKILIFLILKNNLFKKVNYFFFKFLCLSKYIIIAVITAQKPVNIKLKTALLTNIISNLLF